MTPDEFEQHYTDYSAKAHSVVRGRFRIAGGSDIADEAIANAVLYFLEPARLAELTLMTESYFVEKVVSVAKDILEARRRVDVAGNIQETSDARIARQYREGASGPADRDGSVADDKLEVREIVRRRRPGAGELARGNRLKPNEPKGDTPLPFGAKRPPPEGVRIYDGAGNLIKNPLPLRKRRRP